MAEHEDHSQGQDVSQRTEKPTFSGKVLVAEDIEGNKKLIKLLLCMLGVDVVVAEDGHQAVEKALSQSFDLILMDMQMPRMTGYEATVLLKKQGYSAPIVAVTASAMIGDEEKCREAGCDDYLTKPIRRKELSRLLAKYLPAAQGTASKAVTSAPERTEASEPARPEQTPSQTEDVAESNGSLNWNRLIDEWGGQEIVSNMLSVYFNDIVENYQALCQAIEAMHFKDIALRAHALKGVGRNLYVDPLRDVAEIVERAGRARDAETITLNTNDLKRQTQVVLNALSECDWITTPETSIS